MISMIIIIMLMEEREERRERVVELFEDGLERFGILPVLILYH